MLNQSVQVEATFLVLRVCSPTWRLNLNGTLQPLTLCGVFNALDSGHIQVFGSIEYWLFFWVFDQSNASESRCESSNKSVYISVKVVVIRFF